MFPKREKRKEVRMRSRENKTGMGMRAAWASIWVGDE